MHLCNVRCHCMLFLPKKDKEKKKWKNARGLKRDYVFLFVSLIVFSLQNSQYTHTHTRIDIIILLKRTNAWKWAENIKQ